MDVIGTMKRPKDVEVFASKLENCLNLKELDISDNSIGDEGAKLIASGLKFCGGLERLKLAGNNIAAASGAFIKILAALKHSNLHEGELP